MPSKKIWKEEDISFIKDNFDKLTIDEISLRINSPKTTLYRKLKELNLKKKVIPPSIGDKIGHLEIIDKKIKSTSHQNITVAICKCRCGKIIERRLTAINTGKIICCGCTHYLMLSDKKKVENFKHGLSNLKGNRLYRIWAGIKSRCYNENTKAYKNYGKRGIRMCDDWFHNYISFHNWSLANGYSSNLTIDRINNSGNYEPSNCRWITMKAQGMNKSTNRHITAFGETKTLTNWLLDPRCKVRKPTDIHYRLRVGWEPERAISEEPRKFRKNEL